MNKVLIVTYGGGHARMLAPVVDRLINISNIEISILALTTATLEFDQESVTLLGYKNFFYKDSNVRRYGEILSRELDKIVDHKETVAYLGKNYLELVETLGKREARKKYTKLGRQAFQPNQALETILKQLNPNLVITTNSPRSEKAAIKAAGKLGIRSIALIDMFAIRCESWFSVPEFADKILVFSSSVKEYLVSKGRDANSVVVTGNPAFDELVQFYNNRKKNIAVRRSLSPFTVLWASQREPEYCQETDLHGDVLLPLKIEVKLLKVFSRHPEWRLIVRNHPSENLREYPEHVRVSTQKEDLLDLLLDVDVVVTLTSTVGFQGAILGTGFITINGSVFAPTMPFYEMGFSTVVSGLDEMEKTLLDFSVKKSSVGRKSVYSVENAAIRVENEILSMLN